jgi:hypothetical protein
MTREQLDIANDFHAALAGGRYQWFPERHTRTHDEAFRPGEYFSIEAPQEQCHVGQLGVNRVHARRPCATVGDGDLDTLPGQKTRARQPRCAEADDQGSGLRINILLHVVSCHPH